MSDYKTTSATNDQSSSSSSGDSSDGSGAARDDPDMPFSGWVDTSRVHLPLAHHFNLADGGSNNIVAGLIRPVKVKHAEGVMRSFAENGNMYDPGKPVGTGGDDDVDDDADDYDDDDDEEEENDDDDDDDDDAHDNAAYADAHDTKVWLIPYIEGNEEAMAVYINNHLYFWKRWMDPNDEFHKTIPALVVDGAHRRFVTVKLQIVQMRANFLQPTMSIFEMVRAALFCRSAAFERITNKNTRSHTLPHAM